MEVTNYLLGYKDLKIVQDKSMFNFSLDSILLPNFVTINKRTTKILDIGCGNAPIPLVLSKKTNAKIIAVEIQKDVALLAQKSVAINDLNEQIEVINDDIKILSASWESDQFDVVVCNPPFFEIKDGKKTNDKQAKTLARHELSLNLNDVFKISKKLLKNNGIIAIVHRPERLLEILELMRENNLEPKKLQFVFPKENKEANILLIEGSKNGNPGLKILPPLYAHDQDGNYTDQIKKYFE